MLGRPLCSTSVVHTIRRKLLEKSMVVGLCQVDVPKLDLENGSYLSFSCRFRFIHVILTDYVVSNTLF